MSSVSDSDRRRLLPFLGAVGLFFAAVEYLLPKPVPFLRLGIANLPLVLTLDLLKPRELFLLVSVKVLGQGLVNGTLASYVILFSAVGSLASITFMLLARRVFGFQLSLIGVSLWGALGSNLAQLVLSVGVLLGSTAWVIAPVVLLSGLVTGFLVGLASMEFSRKSLWFGKLRRVLQN